MSFTAQHSVLSPIVTGSYFRRSHRHIGISQCNDQCISFVFPSIKVVKYLADLPWHRHVQTFLSLLLADLLMLAASSYQII